MGTVSVSIRKLWMGAVSVSDLKTSNYSQGQGSRAFERGRSTLRRTIKYAD